MTLQDAIITAGEYKLNHAKIRRNEWVLSAWCIVENGYVRQSPHPQGIGDVHTFNINELMATDWEVVYGENCPLYGCYFCTEFQSQKTKTEMDHNIILTNAILRTDEEIGNCIRENMKGTDWSLALALRSLLGLHRYVKIKEDSK